MKKAIWKKPIAVVMAAAMVVSMTGCGKKEGSSKEKDVAAEDTKDMVYEGTDLALSGIEGDISNFVVKKDKLYIQTYQWMEDEDDSEEKDDKSKGDTDEGEGAEDSKESSEENSEEEGDKSSQDAGETDSSSEEPGEDENDKSSEETSESDDEALEENGMDKTDLAFEVSDVTGRGTAADDGSEEQEEASEGQDGKEAEDKDDEGSDAASDGQEDQTSAETDEKVEDEVSDDGIDIGGDETAQDEDDDEYYAKGRSETHLYSANLDGSDIKEMPLNLSEEDYMNYLMIGEDGALTYMTYTYDEKTEQSSNILVKMDADGNEVQRVDVTKSLELGEDSYISKILLDAKGNVIVIAEQTVYILDENFEKTGEVKSENYLEGAALTKDGQVICASSVYSDEKSSAQVLVLDTEGKKWGDTITLDLSYFSGNESLMDGYDYDFYYKDDSGIYGYDMAGKTGKKLMDYVASNLTSENTYGIVPIGDDRFMGIVYDYESGDGYTTLAIYEKVDPSSIANKQTITYGAYWINEDVKRAAIAFNKASKDYQITFKDYSNEEDPVSKMNADIIAGNVPDIIDLSEMSVEQYAAKGLLEDLTPYFEKDPDINAEDLIPSVLETMKVDGKLYYVAPSFYLYSLAGKTSDVGTDTGWTFDDFKALLEKKGDDVRPFYSDNRSDMLYSLAGVGLSDFVDWTTGECSFDSQDFKDILQLCYDKGVDAEMEWTEDTPSTEKLIRDGKILFREGYVDLDEFPTVAQIFGEDVNYIGYPNKDKQGSYFLFNSQIAIYSKSDVKDGAWEFIRTFMTKEYQGKTMDPYYTPTRQDCFDLLIEAKMATEEYTNELGREIYPQNGSYGYGDGIELELKPMTQEEADKYIALVSNTKKSGRYDTTLMELVQEEAKPYFAGEKSLDETADIIQNRIKTYVNENR